MPRKARTFAVGPLVAVRARSMRVWLLGTVFLWFFATHLYRISEGPNGSHIWRETDTITLAKNFAFESWNVLEPRIDARGTGDGVVGAELPIYSVLVGMVMAVFGHVHWPARLITLLATFVLFFAFARLVRRLDDRPQLAPWAVALMAASPIVFFYARSMQPDMLALTCATLGVWLWLEGRLVPAALLLACAGGIKPTFLCVGLPMLSQLKRVTWRQLVFGVCVLTPVALWLHHARSFHTGYFFLGDDFGGWLRALRGAVHEELFWQQLFAQWPIEHIAGLVPFVLAILGAIVARPRRASTRFFLLWFIGAYVAALASPAHLATGHDYYLLPAVPAVVFFCAHFSLVLLVRWPRLAIGAVVIAVLVAPVRMRNRWGVPYDYAAERQIVDQHIPADALVVSVDSASAVALYRVGRRGWRFPPNVDAAEIRNAYDAGARFIAVREQAHSPSLGRHLFDLGDVHVYTLAR